jgi:glyoxylase-like metal-dependent hydrolase (beta-lactamase superfamily II)
MGEVQDTTLGVWSPLRHPLVSDAVIPGIDTLRQPLSGPTTEFNAAAIYEAAVIIESDDQLAVVDPGFTYHVDAYLKPYLESRGKKLSDVTLIIDSHDHFDHAQANPALKGASGARVAAHESAATTVPGGVDIPLHDGDQLDVGSFHFEVVHLPGHSETCIGLYEPSDKVFVLGDSLQGNGGVDQGLVILTDIPSYKASVKKVLSYEVEHLVPAHPYRGASAPIMRGRQIKDYLQLCLDWVEKYESETIRILSEAKEPMTETELQELLLGSLAYDPEELKYYFLKFLGGFSRVTVDALLAQSVPDDLKEKVRREGWLDVGNVYSSGE